jgi:hypothetical protein
METPIVGDEYERVRQLQNSNQPCPHCKAEQGHTFLCPLINRETAEAHSAERSEADRLILHALGVKW